MSKWAYEQCLNGNDILEIRNLITDNYLIYKYCYEIEDKEDMWIKITEPEWAYWYCINVKDRPEVKKYITNKNYLNILEKTK